MTNHIGPIARLVATSSILLLVLLVTSVPSATAESYSVAVNPSTVQEGESLTISLTVTGAQPGTQYEFVIAVLDPSTTLHTSTVTYDTSPVQTSFVASRTYPIDFPSPAKTQYVGSYQIFVDQVRPSATPNVASGSFSVRLSDKTSYERTQTVQIRASGYDSGEQVTVDIRSGTQSVSGYPSSQVSNNQGTVVLTWTVPANATVGTYKLSINSTTTVKSTPDREDFDVSEATLTLAEFTTDKSIYSRGEKIALRLTAIYPSGSTINSGEALVSIRRPQGTIFPTSASYNSSAGRFEAFVVLNRTDEVGVWMASVQQNALDDGFGNSGPSVTRQISVTVQALQLQVSMSVGASELRRGDVFAVHAKVSYPDGTNVTSGVATATILYQGNPLRDISLRYYPTEGSWEGTYVVRSDDPTGDWLVRVVASDGASPENTGYASAPVKIAEPWLTSSLFLFLLLAGAGVGVLVGFLFLSRRKVTRKQLKVDLQVIESEVKKIQEKDFFKSITDQLSEQGLDNEEEENK